MIKQHDNANLELDEEHRTGVLSFRAELGNRLRALEKRFGNRAQAAEAAGVAKSTFQNWVEGKSDPSFEGLSKFAAASGVSLDWLAPADQVDQALMGRCADAFGKLYKELGIALSLTDLGRLAAEAYNDMAAAGAGDMDIPTQLAVIKGLVAKHRRELLSEAAANASGKRSAS